MLMFWIIIIFISLALGHSLLVSYRYARQRAMIDAYLELNRKRRVDALYGRLSEVDEEETNI